MTIDATAGGSSSNSYCTLAEADTYHEGVFHKDDWNVVDVDKEVALIQATAILDMRYTWAGKKKTDDQALRWPRTGVADVDGYALDSDVIPKALKNATAEFARYLISNDPSVVAGKGISSVEGIVFDKADKADQIPDNVKSMLAGLGSLVGQNPSSSVQSVGLMRA